MGGCCVFGCVGLGENVGCCTMLFCGGCLLPAPLLPPPPPPPLPLPPPPPPELPLPLLLPDPLLELVLSLSSSDSLGSSSSLSSLFSVPELLLLCCWSVVMR